MSLGQDIRWTLDSAAPSSSRPVLAVAIEALPAIEDDLGADTIELLALTITDLRDELAAVRATRSAALTHAHLQHLKIRRLRQRLADLHDEARRAEKRSASS